MDNNFSGDYEFFQECEDARVEVFEMFDVEDGEDVEDGDCGEDYSYYGGYEY